MNMCLFEVAMWVNAEVAISIRRGGVKILSTRGGGGGGGVRSRGLPIWGGGLLLLGGSVPHYMPCNKVRHENVQQLSDIFPLL